MKLALAVVAAAAALPALAQGTAVPDVAAEVQKGVTAYNSQDLKYYEAILDPEVTYIADDGAIFPGRERVVGLFKRLFSRPTPPKIEISEVVIKGRGDTAWATFKWSLSAGEKSRPGVSTTLFRKDAGQWKVVLIQNTAAGHTMPAGAPPHKD